MASKRVNARFPIKFRTLTLFAALKENAGRGKARLCALASPKHSSNKNKRDEHSTSHLRKLIYKNVRGVRTNSEFMSGVEIAFSLYSKSKDDT